MSGSWVAIVAVPVVLRWMVLYAQTTKAKRRHGATVFPATSLAALCAVSVILATAAAVGGWRQGDGRTTIPIGIVWAAGALLMWPTTIILDSNGVTAKHIWRPSRTIRYEDIDYVSRIPDGKTIVYGNGKVKEIPVSEFHVDSDRFERELRKQHVKFYAGGL